MKTDRRHPRRDYDPLGQDRRDHGPLGHDPRDHRFRGHDHHRRRRQSTPAYRIVSQQDYLAGIDPFAAASAPEVALCPAPRGRRMRRVASAAALTGAVGTVGGVVGLARIHGYTHRQSAGPLALAAQPERARAALAPSHSHLGCAHTACVAHTHMRRRGAPRSRAVRGMRAIDVSYSTTSAPTSGVPTPSPSSPSSTSSGPASEASSPATPAGEASSPSAPAPRGAQAEFGFEH